MRLICPNCGAQYEVPDDVIPAEGRDVQCSNCGDTWFQAHPDAAQPEEQTADPIQTTADAPADDAEEDVQETFEEVEPPEVSFDDTETDETDLGGADWDIEDDLETDDAYGDAADGPALFEDDVDDEVEDDWQEALADEDHHAEPEGDDPDLAQDVDDQEDNEESSNRAPVPQRRGIDPSVANVLRQEAEHEAQVRAEERQTLETQAELGLRAPSDEATKRASEARDRMRKLRGLTDDDVDVTPVPAPQTEIRDSRKDLLPDIEETNSTLRHAGDTPQTGEAAVDLEAEQAGRGRGFRMGFVFVILIAAAAVFVYSRNDQLAASYPQFAPQIEEFVDGANNTRVWLDTKVTNLFLWLNELSGNTPDGEG